MIVRIEYSCDTVIIFVTYFNKRAWVYKHQTPEVLSLKIESMIAYSIQCAQISSACTLYSQVTVINRHVPCEALSKNVNGIN